MTRDSNGPSGSHTPLDDWAGRELPALPAGLPRALLAAVADGSDPVIVVDRASTRLIYANGATGRLLGYPEGELTGVRLGDLAVDPRPEALDRLLDEASRPGEKDRRVTLPLRHSDGHELACPWLVTVLGEEGIVVLVGRMAESPRAGAVSRDPLTGLPDRLAFESRMRRILRPGGDSSERSFALLFLDLDDFKRVNDQFGHLVGDVLLAALAARLEAAIRPGDLAARHGGDEFVVVLDRVCGDDAGRIAERLVGELRKPVEVEGREYSVSASVGIVLGRAAEGDLGGLLRAADAAMYQAKSRGGGAYAVFDERTCPLARPEDQP